MHGLLTLDFLPASKIEFFHVFLCDAVHVDSDHLILLFDVGNFTVPVGKPLGGLMNKGNPLGFETIRPGGQNMGAFSNAAYLSGMMPGMAGNASGNLAGANNIPANILNSPYFQCEYVLNNSVFPALSC